jgi:hypothetical protein
MPPEDESDYAVGYGKPPRHTRFRHGRSGNPKGRPPGAKNLASVLERVLGEAVVVSENGRRRKISKGEAVIKQLVNKAAAGDARAMRMLLGEIRQLQGRADASADAVVLDDADQLVIDQLQRRLQQLKPGQKDHDEVNQ